jgi:predicted Zn-dependent protease with MMP-like domain
MTATLLPTSIEDLVSDALDRLPAAALDAIAATPILVMPGPADSAEYGRPNGDGLGAGLLPDRIVLYRDALERDFGDDPAVLADVVESELRGQITALGLH